MPYRSQRPCNFPHCNDFALANKPYCLKHCREKQSRFQRESKKDYTSNEMYNHRWKKLRRLILRSNPFCGECLKSGHHMPAIEVDHIIPHKGDKTNFYNEDNLKSLCKSCHSKKTMLEYHNAKK